jgi:hypothetical protein
MCNDAWEMIESSFPDDIVDRFWYPVVASNNEVISSNKSTINMGNSELEYVPMSVMQTNAVAATRDGLLYNFPAGWSGSLIYSVNLFFVEHEPQVKNGERVFDIQYNGSTIASNIDIFNITNGKLHTLFQYYTVTANGPYNDSLIVMLKPTASSIYLPSLATYESMNLFENPMVSPSSSNDGNNNGLYFFCCIASITSLIT